MLLCFLIFFFFFFKQKTAYEMRISDWSSDVCSSDLDDGSDYGDQISGTRPQASPGSHCATVRLAGHCRDARQVGHGGEAAKLYRGGPSLSVLLAESGRIGGGTGLARADLLPSECIGDQNAERDHASPVPGGHVLLQE